MYFTSPLKGGHPPRRVFASRAFKDYMKVYYTTVNYMKPEEFSRATVVLMILIIVRIIIIVIVVIIIVIIMIIVIVIQVILVMLIITIIKKNIIMII